MGGGRGLFFDVFTSGLHVILTTGSAQHSYGVLIDAAELRHFIMTEVSISSETQALSFVFFCGTTADLGSLFVIFFGETFKCITQGHHDLPFDHSNLVLGHPGWGSTHCDLG